MSNLADAMKLARAGSLARRPAIANVGPNTSSTAQGQGGEFEGRTRMGGAAFLSIERIVPDEGQPRKTFDDGPLGRLAENMKARGQLVPILVRWNAQVDRYVIIDGERRYRAARLAGIPTMACVIEDQSDPDQILEMQLIANALREDVTPVEQAKAWDRLMKSQGLSQKELAGKLGYDPGTVTRSLGLLNLPTSIQESVDAGQIPAQTAYELSRVADPGEQAQLAEEAKMGHLTRDDLRDRVTRSRASAKGKRSKTQLKAKARTSRTFQAGGGLKITAERARGLDLSNLVEALRAFAAEIEAEVNSHCVV